jgi:NAD(P)-dependent dehydrogenase (short-subunit alcohol dehydrogenase family)
MDEMQKIVIVTGASRGLGLAIVQAFASTGWQAIGTGRSPRPHELPETVEYHQFDASDTEACEKFWNEIGDKYPDAKYCLVNNAGGYVSGRLTDLEPKDYMQQMQSTYFSAVYMTRGMAMVTAKARILNIISSSALDVYMGEAAYGPAKAAERHFFQIMQLEFATSKYRITNLYPTNIASHGTEPSGIAPSELAEFVRMQAESTASYYLRDVTVYPTAN